MAGERILVIDDAPQAREFAAEYVLKPNGFEVMLARDGAEGIRLALHSPPDLIILDYEMPKMNGLEVLRALSARNLAIPVILSTAHGSEAPHWERMLPWWSRMVSFEGRSSGSSFAAMLSVPFSQPISPT